MYKVNKEDSDMGVNLMHWVNLLEMIKYEIFTCIFSLGQTLC